MRFGHLGTDLSVLAGHAAHDGESRDLRATPVRGVRVRIEGADRTDLAVVSERENLGQALVLRLLTPRLLTPRGALRDLGHADYGSRLHELIGRLKTAAVRNLCRALVLEAIAREPRVDQRAAWFEFDLDRETPSSLAFRVAVRPVAGGDLLELALEVGL